MPCTGNPGEICGGPDAINIYQHGLQLFTTGPVNRLVQRYKGFHLTQCWM